MSTECFGGYEMDYGDGDESMYFTLDMEGWPIDLRTGRRFDPLADVNLHGKPVKKTKMSHPYNYDEFVLHRLGPNKEIDGCVYVDRMYEWDREKTKQLWKKHLDTRWDRATASQIEEFLREWNDDPGLKLIAVVEWCNQASGYPTWSLHFKSGKKTK